MIALESTTYILTVHSLLWDTILPYQAKWRNFLTISFFSLSTYIMFQMCYIQIFENSTRQHYNYCILQSYIFYKLEEEEMLSIVFSRYFSLLLSFLLFCISGFSSGFISPHPEQRFCFLLLNESFRASLLLINSLNVSLS